VIAEERILRQPGRFECELGTDLRIAEERGREGAGENAQAHGLLQQLRHSERGQRSARDEQRIAGLQDHREIWAQLAQRARARPSISGIE
jgi:hypothetical protein